MPCQIVVAQLAPPDVRKLSPGPITRHRVATERFRASSLDGRCRGSPWHCDRIDRVAAKYSQLIIEKAQQLPQSDQICARQTDNEYGCDLMGVGHRDLGSKESKR